jgi:SAM-dependent methyltransferase
MTEHVYNNDFYDYISQGSRRSAEVIVPLILNEIELHSVLDVGAGKGAWLAEWMNQGITDACAVDGAYVDTERLMIPAANFHPHDLAIPLHLGRRFDLVQSLEVAEHLPEGRAGDFVDTLVSHGDVVLFSAAVRHQGGEYHLNEQPPEYWQRKFAARDYACFDWLRPLLAGHPAVKPWYRFNTLLYANGRGQQRLSERVLAHRLLPETPAPMRGDLAWNARRAAVAFLPRSSRHLVARMKALVETRVLKNS